MEFVRLFSDGRAIPGTTLTCGLFANESGACWNVRKRVIMCFCRWYRGKINSRRTKWYRFVATRSPFVSSVPSMKLIDHSNIMESTMNTNTSETPVTDRVFAACRWSATSCSSHTEQPLKLISFSSRTGVRNYFSYCIVSQADMRWIELCARFAFTLM